MSGRTGVLVTIEGGDGAGKSTLARSLAASLRADDLPVVLTREPGGTPLADGIRALALDAPDEAIDGETEALLFSAARRSHYRTLILPALREGSIVICDRFIDSTMAYQGAGKGVSEPTLQGLQRLAIGDDEPDLTLVVQANAVCREARLAGRPQEQNRLDTESAAFKARVEDYFRSLPGRAPWRARPIDGSRSAEEVLTRARAAIAGVLPGRLVPTDGAHAECDAVHAALARATSRLRAALLDGGRTPTPRHIAAAAIQPKGLLAIARDLLPNGSRQGIGWRPEGLSASLQQDAASLIHLTEFARSGQAGVDAALRAEFDASGRGAGGYRAFVEAIAQSASHLRFAARLALPGLHLSMGGGAPIAMEDLRL